MRTLNLRLAAICLMVIVLFSGGVHLLHGFQVHRKANALRVASERANEAFEKLRDAWDLVRDSMVRADTSKAASERVEELARLLAAEEKDPEEVIRQLQTLPRKELLRLGTVAKEKNLAEAIRLLQIYVALEGKDIEQKLHLGLMFAEKPDPKFEFGYNPRAAFNRLEEVFRTDEATLATLPPDDVRQARLTLVHMAMQVGRLSDAETHLKKLMEETPRDPELLYLNGRILYYNEKFDEARATPRGRQRSRQKSQGRAHSDRKLRASGRSFLATRSQAGCRQRHGRDGQAGL